MDKIVSLIPLVAFCVTSVLLMQPEQTISCLIAAIAAYFMYFSCVTTAVFDETAHIAMLYAFMAISVIFMNTVEVAVCLMSSVMAGVIYLFSY